MYISNKCRCKSLYNSGGVCVSRNIKKVHKDCVCAFFNLIAIHYQISN